MSDKKTEVKSETILMTLDQIGQTIEIMTNVVGRLRGYITEQIEDNPEGDFERDLDLVTHEGPRTLH